VQEVTAVTDFCVGCHDVRADSDDAGMYVEFEAVDVALGVVDDEHEHSGLQDVYPELYVCSSCLSGGD
jgi:6-pyruvoyl-tetrahydropterin synthase